MPQRELYFWLQSVVAGQVGREQVPYTKKAKLLNAGLPAELLWDKLLTC